MKKTVSMIMAVWVLAFAFAACGSKPGPANSGTNADGALSTAAVTAGDDDQGEVQVQDSGGSFETANKQVEYINPAMQSGGDKLAVTTLYFDHDMIGYSALMTLELEGLDLSAMQLDSENGMKNENTTFYDYGNFLVRTSSVNFDVNKAMRSVLPQFSDVILTDGAFTLMYNYSEYPYSMFVHVYNYEQDDDLYAEIILEPDREQEITEQEAINAFEVLKESVHFYIPLSEEENNVYANYQDINGQTADIGSYVFYNDMMANLLAQAKIYVSNPAGFDGADIDNIFYSTYVEVDVYGTLVSDLQPYSISFGGQSWAQDSYDNAELYDTFTLNGVEVEMRFDEEYSSIYFIIGEMGAEDYVVIQTGLTYLMFPETEQEAEEYMAQQLLDEKDYFLRTF